MALPLLLLYYHKINGNSQFTHSHGYVCALQSVREWIMHESYIVVT